MVSFLLILKQIFLDIYKIYSEQDWKQMMERMANISKEKEQKKKLKPVTEEKVMR